MQSNSNSQQVSFLALRIMVSVIMFSHGGIRLFEGHIGTFGEYLNSQGIPFGTAVAGFITFFEILGAPFLAMGKKLAYICPVYSVILTAGIIMVHLQNGWFVVGKSTNGIEYSLLLITALFSIGFPHVQQLIMQQKNMY